AIAAQDADLGAGIKRQPDVLEHLALTVLLGQALDLIDVLRAHYRSVLEFRRWSSGVSLSAYKLTVQARSPASWRNRALDSCSRSRQTSGSDARILANSATLRSAQGDREFRIEALPSLTAPRAA